MKRLLTMSGLFVILLLASPRLDAESPDEAQRVASSPHAPVVDADAAASPTVPTVAIYPAINRAGPEYDALGDAITMIAGSVIDQSGKAVVVNRDQFASAMQERQAARFELTDKPELGRTGRVIGADYLLFPVYDVIDGEFTIRAQWLPVPDPTPDTHHRLNSTGRIQFPGNPIRGMGGLILTNLLGDVQIDEIESTPLPADAAIGILQIIPVGNDPSMAARARVVEDALTQSVAALPLRLVERAAIEKIIREKTLTAVHTLRGEALGVGELTGADFMMIGSLLETNNESQLDLHILDVPTGAVLCTYTIASDFKKLPERLPAIMPALLERMQRGYDRVRFVEANKPIEPAEASVVSMHGVRQLPTTLVIGEYLDDATINSALPWIHLAMELDAGNGEVWADAGTVLRHSRHFPTENIEHVFRRAVELSPNSFQCRLGLGRTLLYEAPDNLDALHQFERAYELAGNTHEKSLAAGNQGIVLNRLKRYEQTIALLTALVREPDCDDMAFAPLADALIKTGRDEEAAGYAFEVALRFQNNQSFWHLAAQTYARIGDEAGVARALELMCRFNVDVDWQTYTDLSNYYAQRDPWRAAMLCYALLDAPPEFAEPAHELLQRMNMPTLQPVMTGQVFNLDELRRRGVFVQVQVFEGFRYPALLPYLRQRLEDTLGVPIRIEFTPHAMNLHDYERRGDLLIASDRTADDLSLIGRDTGAVAVIGLVSARLETNHVMWTAGTTGIITSSVFDNRMRSDRPEVTAQRVSSMLYVSMAHGIVNTMSKPLNHCIVHRCMFGKIGSDIGRYDPGVPCPDCRHRIHALHPDWPTGPAKRSELAAGPARPAVPNANGDLLLVKFDDRASDLRLAETAVAMEAVTGLHADCVTLPLAGLPANEAGALLPSGIRDAVMRYIREQGIDPQAICVLVRDQVATDPPRNLEHLVYLPDVAQHEVDRPIVFASLGRIDQPITLMQQRLRTQSSLEVPGEQAETLPTMVYAKYFIAGLAVAARVDHQCWTYGCPATIWEANGDPFRCSHWLCADCREAMNDYFGGK